MGYKKIKKNLGFATIKFFKFHSNISKNNFDAWCRQAAYNIRKGLKILKVATV